MRDKTAGKIQINRQYYVTYQSFGSITKAAVGSSLRPIDMRAGVAIPTVTDN